MPKTPNYLRVYNDLVQLIESGRLKPGDAIPTARDLQAQHGVGNTAVRMALLLLKERGYVEGHQGKRVFVKERGS